MSNRRFRRRKNADLSPEGRLPVDAYTATQLRQFLVVDAVGQHATHLPWFVAACLRIGELERIGPERAFKSIEHEVQTLTGRGLPVYSGPIIGGSPS